MDTYLTFVLSIFIYSNAFSQNWTFDELQKANTAANILNISHEEKEAIKYINLARLFPEKFGKLEVENYLGPEQYGDYLSTSTYKRSLLLELNKRASVGPLYFDESMYLLASCFSKESGDLGIVGHNRISCSENYDAECCSYGMSQGKDIAIQLLIDHDVPSLGHREICLDGEFDKVGASIQNHKIYHTCCVLNFKRKYVPIKNVNYQSGSQIRTSTYRSSFSSPNSNKSVKYGLSYPKSNKWILFKCGGAVNFLIDDINYINSPILGQMSYQMNVMAVLIIGKSQRRSAIGFFCNTGRYNKNNLTVKNSNLYNATDRFVEVESGFLLSESLRISVGLGYMPLSTFNFKSITYSSITSGISVGPRWFKIDFLNTMLISKNEKKIGFRPSVGLAWVLAGIKK
jgi:hypothetical protein